MRWEIALAVGAVLVFFGLRLTARGWIIDRWIDGKLGDLQAGVLLALIYLTPMLLLLASAAIGMPESMNTIFLVVAVIGVPLVAILGGLVDYATIRGVKEMLRQKRAARLAAGDDRR
ncbi:MAG TPA: hypothetical protein VFN76_08020 [Candidatus Limnocylindria bacterium]|nr:hypothetical protein [Candidatus Limnocylindria bacterium]